MLDITVTNNLVALCGRFDSSQADKARAEFARLSGEITLDLSGMDYISSLGLGLIFALHSRLNQEGGGLRMIHCNPHVLHVFHLAGLKNALNIE